MQRTPPLVGGHRSAIGSWSTMTMVRVSGATRPAAAGGGTADDPNTGSVHGQQTTGGVSNLISTTSQSRCRAAGLRRSHRHAAAATSAIAAVTAVWTISHWNMARAFT